MRLTAIKPGDIVQCNKKGRLFHAKVVGAAAPGMLRVQPIERNISYRHVNGVGDRRPLVAQRVDPPRRPQAADADAASTSATRDGALPRIPAVSGGKGAHAGRWCGGLSKSSSTMGQGSRVRPHPGRREREHERVDRLDRSAQLSERPCPDEHAYGACGRDHEQSPQACQTLRPAHPQPPLRLRTSTATCQKRVVVLADDPAARIVAGVLLLIPGEGVVVGRMRAMNSV